MYPLSLQGRQDPDIDPLIGRFRPASTRPRAQLRDNDGLLHDDGERNENRGGIHRDLLEGQVQQRGQVRQRGQAQQRCVFASPGQDELLHAGSVLLEAQDALELRVELQWDVEQW